jgi:hypothetical protein
VNSNSCIKACCSEAASPHITTTHSSRTRLTRCPTPAIRTSIVSPSFR